jgi:hypothetical protein
MRGWVGILVVVIAFGVLAASAQWRETESEQSREADAAFVGESDAANGEEADLEAQDNGTFSGSFAPPSTCDTKTFLVSAGTTTIDVAATAILPTNDITLELINPSGGSAGFSDTATSPEAVHYSSTTAPAGTWTVKVCPAGNGAIFLPPYDYNGVFTTTGAPVPDLPGTGGTGVDGGSAGTPTPTRADGNIAFSPETIIDPQRTEGEPVNLIAPDGTYWESGPFGTSTSQSFVHRSTDNGLEFHTVSATELRPDAPPGGGDTDIAVDDQGYAYFSDLEGLVNVGTSVSNDNGNTWRKNTLASQEVGVDRQWYAMDDGTTTGASDNTLFFVYRQTPLGSQILSSPGSTGAGDQVGGLQWTNAASAPGQLAISSGAPCGKLFFDPVNRNLYMPCGKGDHIEVVIGHVAPGQRTNVDFHTVELQPAPPKGDPSTVFPWLGIDAAGNVMVVWIDGTDRNVYESVSKDQGATWTAPVQANAPPATTNVFPEVTGGKAGTFAIAWYGNESTKSSDDQPANTSADAGNYPWYGYVAVVTHADTLKPDIAQQRFTKHPMHYGLVCNGGTTCTSGRTMADYFDVAFDRQGSIRLAFDDESSQYRQAHLMEVRQLRGAAPSSPMADPAGDAQVPHYSASGPGSNQAQLDFTRLALSQPADGVLRVQMSLANLADLSPPPGKTSAVWLTRFQAKSVLPNGAEAYRIFYVGAKSLRGAKPTFFAGSGDDPSGCLSTSSGCKILTYQAEQTLTSGSVSGNTISIDVSLGQGFGTTPQRNVNGSVLYSVTALSYGQNADADVYAEGDATHSFDYALGGVPTEVPQPTAAPRASASGGGSGQAGPAAGPAAAGGQGGVAGQSKNGRRFVRGAGSVHALGRIGSAVFSVDLRKGPGHKVTYVDARQKVRFRSLRLSSLRFGTASATLKGVGLLNGKRVSFIASAVDHGKRGDVFRIAWAGGRSHGGVLIEGGLMIR